MPGWTSCGDWSKLFRATSGGLSSFPSAHAIIVEDALYSLLVIFLGIQKNGGHLQGIKHRRWPAWFFRFYVLD